MKDGVMYWYGRSGASTTEGPIDPMISTGDKLGESI